MDALAFLGASELAGAVEQARRDEPAEPLLRGDEVGLPPGPEIGRLLARLLDAAIDDPSLNERERLLELARELHVS